MKKLKEEPISHFKIVFLIIFFVNCKGNLPKQENRDKQGDVSNEMTLTKEFFFNCTGARDTFFANGDYLKYIPIDKEHYEIEVKINDILDTLDFYLGCKTHSGMIPKVLFKSDLGYLGLGQGSSSYRYLTLCSLNKEAKKININKFETAIDVASENDGLLFIKDNWLFLYDLSRNKFFCKKLLSDGKSFVAKEFELYKNRAAIICEDGNSQTYFLDEFIVRDSIPNHSI
ncbi:MULTISPECIES: hypothetical protein [Niastella]|uniref:Lipoprotein n=1 Tax=Niastella soli TaxID=2821487 RepID=A0ABS3YZM2_9BACT|nr:hypothetical protein [Niastella soli]MBO9203384.1 hypothetical protein [Niastella soli]